MSKKAGGRSKTKRSKSSAIKKIRGSDARPRLCVFRSLRYTYAQLISDESAKVIVSASTKSMADTVSKRSSVDGAKELGQKIAELAKAKEISRIVFDRNGYVYHGRVAAVAQGAREGGLDF
ncbi:MAG: 50S ribosomal protein L18 [Deltaproteobacteria bacterium]|nr:50S ribosomal protein L18 [Deltaproteobacteria bacterium]